MHNYQLFKFTITYIYIYIRVMRLPRNYMSTLLHEYVEHRGKKITSVKCRWYQTRIQYAARRICKYINNWTQKEKFLFYFGFFLGKSRTNHSEYMLNFLELSDDYCGRHCEFKPKKIIFGQNKPKKFFFLHDFRKKIWFRTFFLPIIFSLKHTIKKLFGIYSKKYHFRPNNFSMVCLR